MTVTDKPANLPSTNALDKFNIDNPEAEIRLAGKTLCVLANPPALGKNVDLVVRLHIAEDCTAVHEDDSEVRYLKAKLIGAWLPGSPPAIGTDGDLWDQAGPAGSIPTEPAPETPPE